MSVIDQLRRKISTIDRRALVVTDRTTTHEQILPVGFAPCDEALGGGLMRGALHEIAASAPLDCGAASGFVTALMAKACRMEQSAPVLWIQARSAMREQGRLYGCGLHHAGIAPHALIAVRVPRSADVLWAMEEALTLGLPLIVGEILRPDRATLTATRRLSLAAESGGGLALLLQHRPSALPSAALTRWRIEAATSRADRYGGLGLPAFNVTLLKNRHGACGRWHMHWHSHDHVFLAPEQLDTLLAQPTLPRGLLPLSPDRPGGARHGGRQDTAARRHRLIA